MSKPEYVIDCRGLACPAPVLRAKETVEQEQVDRLVMLVDNEAAKENVSRFLSRAGYTVWVEESEGALAVVGDRSAGLTKPVTAQGSGPVAPASAAAAVKIMVVVGTDRLGSGDDFLGGRLMVNFISTLKEMGSSLWALIFLNAGVNLACTGSEVLSVVQELAKAGVQVLVCGTCLNHFHLLEQKQVGETTNMLDIVTHMQLADKVITLT
ncbi:MAG: sulfurtransferase-like selenium metabolism protein YedF [Desulfobacca sp.]|uniref:sulfurtransferase-like selenium metabolism protein YedF n=1 Tax=Desulfobacca sp. TaxID=2067990 RepID=UPI0040493733